MSTIIWSEFASTNLKHIYQYHKMNAGSIVAKKIKNNILKITSLISKQPEMGQIEVWLAHLYEGHRQVVVGNYKLIYKIIDDKILITDIFDTRQNPISINDSNRI